MWRENEMSRKHHAACALYLTAVIACMSLPSCAGMTSLHSAPTLNRSDDQRVRLVLDDIYASRKPVRFEQLDVSEIVLRQIPRGTEKETIAAAFASSPTTRVIEDTPTRLVLRDDKSRAMLDPDARSIVMTFEFDLAGRLAEVKALHLRQR